MTGAALTTRNTAAPSVVPVLIAMLPPGTLYCSALSSSTTMSRSSSTPSPTTGPGSSTWRRPRPFAVRLSRASSAIVARPSGSETERGLRRALGARGRHVATQFLLEAAALAVIRGILGVALGCLATAVVAHVGGNPVTIPLSARLAGLGAAIAVGSWPAPTQLRAPLDSHRLTRSVRRSVLGSGVRPAERRTPGRSRRGLGTKRPIRSWHPSRPGGQRPVR